MLFVNGTNDFAYPPDSWNKSTSLPKGPVWRSFTIKLPHGHIFTFKEVNAFIDSFLLKDARPLAAVSAIQVAADMKSASATFRSEVPIVKAELIGTTDSGIWQKRDWVPISATVAGDKVIAALPEPFPTAYCLLLTDERGLRVSTPIVIP